MGNRPQVLIACSERVRRGYLPPEELTRLEQVADWAWFACEGGNIYQASEDAEAIAQLVKELAGVDALVVCHGAPRVNAAVLEAAPGCVSSANWKATALPRASTWTRRGRGTSARSIRRMARLIRWPSGPWR